MGLIDPSRAAAAAVAADHSRAAAHQAPVSNNVGLAVVHSRDSCCNAQHLPKFCLHILTSSKAMRVSLPSRFSVTPNGDSQAYVAQHSLASP